MRVNYPYLKDEKFLNLADKQRLQTQYIKLTLLDWNENPIQEIQGIATGGTISLSGSSAIRRTCTLNMTLDEIAETAITSVKNLISINKKLFLEIGIVNKTNKYPEYPILWYPQGTFVFTSCNLSSGIGQGYTLSAQLKDKMCLLNGECGGTFTSSVELDKYDTLDPETGEMYTTKNTISQIIRELVNHFGKIPLDKIIINDIDEQIKMTMRWSGDMPLYLAQKDSSYLYTTSYADAIAYGGNIKTFQYGEDCGFILTDFIYPSELIANIGDNICTILDKVKNTLGNYEYYFDIDGNFIFQEIKNYLNTTQATVNLQNMQNDDYKIDIAKGKSVYDFKDAELIINYSNNPNYSNIKNDYVVWGIKENANKIKIPIRYHLAIDSKPQTGNIYNVYMYYDTEDGLLKAKMPVGFENKAHFPTIGNEELFYLDKSTGFVYKWDVDKRMYVSPDGKEYGVYSDTEPGNNNTIYVDSTELQTGSGTNANLTNTAGNRKLSFKKYYGNTTQETTSGKNIFNKDGASLTSGVTKTTLDTGLRVTLSGAGNYRYAGIELGKDELLGKTITIYSKITPSASNNGCVALYFSKIGGSIAVQSLGSFTTTGSKTITIPSTFPSNADKISLLFYGNLNGTSAGGDYVDYTNVQVEIGNQATSYEPYTHGPTPNPYYPQPINVVTGGNTISVVGKNLINVEDFLSKAPSYTKVDDNKYDFTTGGTFYTKGLEVNIKPPFTLSYKIKNGTGKRFRVRYIWEDGTASSGVNSGDGTTETTITNTFDYVESRGNLVEIRGDWGTSGTFTINDFMVNYGSTTLPYEEYIGHNYEVNLGKNLWDWTQNNITLIKSTNRTTNIYPTSSIILEAGTYTISFPNLEMANNNYNMNIQMLGVENYGEQLINKSRTFTINEKKTLTRLYVYLSSSDNDNATATFSEIQLEKGTQATSYSPYKTPIELNKINTYQDTIFKSSGKQLWDEETILGYYNDSGTWQTRNDILSSKNPIYVNPSKSYYFKAPSQAYYTQWTSNGTFISRTNIPLGYGTLTLDSNCGYILFNMLSGYGTTYKNDIMINEGTTALPYEPYGKDWYIKKEIGKVVLDGSEASWGIANSGTANWYYRLTYTTNIVAGTGLDALCNYYPLVSISNNDTRQGLGIVSSYFRIRWGTEDTITNFKTWLNTHNVIIYYPINTPTYTKITDEELLGQIEALENATTYDNVTNILQSNTDLPLTMDYTYYTKKEDSTSSKRYVWEVHPTSEHYTEIMNEINDVNESYIEDIADEQAAIAALEEQIKGYNDALAALDITYKEGLTREKSLHRQISNLQNQTQTAAITAKILELQTELAALQAGDLAPYYTNKTELESSISTAEAAIETNQAAIDAATATRDAAIAELTANLGEYKSYTDNAFVTLKTTDWRSELYLSGVAAEALGLDQNYYYAELAAEWPKLYNFLADSYIDSETGQTIYTGDFTDGVKNNPWSVDYWLDFIDSESAIGGLSVDNIGRRSITKSSDDYNCVFESEIPDLVLIKEDTETTDKEREACEKRGQDYCQVESSIYDLLISGGWANSCFNEIKNLLWFNTSYNSSINLSLIPIYHLEPNTRITVQSVENDIHGDYMMNALSIPLTYNSTMSISGTQVQTKL